MNIWTYSNCKCEDKDIYLLSGKASDPAKYGYRKIGFSIEHIALKLDGYVGYDVEVLVTFQRNQTNKILCVYKMRVLKYYVENKALFETWK